MVNTASPTTLTFKSSPEPLLSFMVHNIDDLVRCSKERIYYQHMLLPDLPKFIKLVYQKCRLSPTVLVIGLIYLERLKKNLPQQAQGEYDTPYKLFLAAMIVATKYIEDYNSHATSIYKIVSPLYTSRELNEMERSFLGVLKVCTAAYLATLY
ncbi:cyclin domain-containing protein [Gilbertella persicaria]|uniref:cyclin domain-containing protein n=1 Tax=Gilbertella persicaria TaxID=101096 RepID=UPI00221ED4D2|nr:cyclin domain-containing protein [Gilbertella persicaria]KAI8087661.1 cyclin domain-containing protein [Gilbertella persicaria]